MAAYLVVQIDVTACRTQSGKEDFQPQMHADAPCGAEDRGQCAEHRGRSLPDTSSIGCDGADRPLGRSRSVYLRVSACIYVHLR